METEKPVLSVTEISLSLKNCVEQVFGDIRVRGEVVGVKKVPSGHTYFSLKDSESVLSAICWRGRDNETMKAVTEGLEVICSGKLSTYPGRSNYQMIVSEARPAGIGALLKLLKERKEKLEKEGLFDISHKKKIPFLPEVIGVITSPAGAVIRDIMHRLEERCPRQVLLWPVLVQGEGAAEQIAAAVDGFNALPLQGIQIQNQFIPRPNVLIVARGGGSFEDLWCFNEEVVVRAVARSQIPLISAVGHETDTTLIDYAADLRSPTPTGAAEKAVPVRAELTAVLEECENRLTDNLYRFWETAHGKLVSLERSLPDLSDVIQLFYERLNHLATRLRTAMSFYVKTEINTLNLKTRLLKSYSYTAVLERGFALITDSTGKIVSDKKTAETLNPLLVRFADGVLKTKPECENERHSFNSRNMASRLPLSSKPKSSSKTELEQPDLFTALYKNIHCNYKRNNKRDTHFKNKN